MKKTIMKNLFFAVMTILLIFCAMISASAADTAQCIGESIEVKSFTQLKNALESFSSGQNIILKQDITYTDNSNDCVINVKKGLVALDFNGCQLKVNSNATKYLFNISEQTEIYFLNGNKEKESTVTFNTKKASAALLRADNTGCEINNINVKYILEGSASGSAVYSINNAAELNVFGGALSNKISEGNGITIANNTNNSSKLIFKMGGGAIINAQEYCINFGTEVKKAIFATVHLDGNGSYERIKLPSGSTLTVGELWPSETGAVTTVTCGSKLPSNSKKITALDKADISATKGCEIINNADYYIVLNCAAGHVQLCGVCMKAYNDIEQHRYTNVSGKSESCTETGKTNGKKCSTCKYSTQKSIPAKGHSIVYQDEIAPTCGVNGTKAHYYCSTCKNYFKDSGGKTSISEKELVIPHNHETELLEAVMPSCSQNGYTAGSRCKTCNRVITEQIVLPKTNHSYPTYWTVVSKADCINDGLNERYCTKCNNRETQVVQKYGHLYNKDGNCVRCNKNINEPDPEPQPTPNPSPNPENPGSSGSTAVNCSCNCHKDGIQKFFFRIILFFQKIFRMNQICKGCGVAHY